MRRQGKRRTTGEKCRSVHIQSRANRYGTPSRPVKISRGKNRRPVFARGAPATMTRHERPLDLLRGQPGRLRLGTGMGYVEGSAAATAARRHPEGYPSSTPQTRVRSRQFGKKYRLSKKGGPCSAVASRAVGSFQPLATAGLGLQRRSTRCNCCRLPSPSENPLRFPPWSSFFS